MSSRRRSGAVYDLEEVRPGHFVLHNPAVAPVLRGEGERIGDRFTLQSQRIDGLLARVRMRGFRVATLADQAGSLPTPIATPLGVLRELQTAERLSRIDVRPASGWQELPIAADGRYQLPLGCVIRRRSGRGPARYALLEAAGLRPLSLDEALLRGYAQQGLPADALRTAADGSWHLRALALPATYQAVLARWSEAHSDGSRSGSVESLELIRLVLSRLVT
jgi:hypothetical protein